MKQFVANIFKQNNFIVDYELLGEPDSFFAERTDEKFDFFTVVFENLESFSVEKMKEKCDELMSNIMKSKSHHLGLDKNLSLVVFLETGYSQNKNKLNSLIYDIEEDPYDFRKYVVTYTENQKSCIDNISKQDLLEVEYLRKRILDQQAFAAYKHGDATQLALEYELISKLFIKLPFLNFNVVSTDLHDLSLIIKNNITQYDNEIWNKLIILEKQCEKEPEIEEILKYFEVLDVE